jgi:transaldolase
VASIAELNRHGQSVWLDFIDRNLLANGGLQRLVDRGVTGVTTNPSIFHKAITAGNDYDGAIRRLLQQDPEASEIDICEALMVADVQAAADILRPVFDRTAGVDGYVSLEVPPDLAVDAEATVAMAHQLRQVVGRPNVMIKVPGTVEGVRAFEQLTADGLSVNVTLLFSVARYEAVLRAWASGIARCAEPASVASVASFFVSRVDGKVDKLLAGKGDAGKALQGRIAIANAKLAYARFQELSAGAEIAGLLAKGARPQRPLWASTSAKNPAYRDVLYVETLVGPHTVNTLPPETLDAFLDHGDARTSITEDIARARADLAALPGLGIELDTITIDLEREGIAAFQDAWDKLLAGVREKCDQLATAG